MMEGRKVEDGKVEDNKMEEDSKVEGRKVEDSKIEDNTGPRVGLDRHIVLQHKLVLIFSFPRHKR